MKNSIFLQQKYRDTHNNHKKIIDPECLHISEWDPTTENKRTWYEAVDHNGKVRSVAPKPVTRDKNY